MKTEISINPDTMKILSATKETVILLGEIYHKNDLCETCVLYIPRKLFHDALDGWLDGKADYHELCNGDFCGVGSIIFKNIKKRKEGAHLQSYLLHSFISIEENYMVNINAYESTEFEIDMEHG